MTLTKPDSAVPDLSELTDDVLVARARDGHCEAFGELWTRHHATARRVAVALAPVDLVDDVVAEAFARILKRVRAGTNVENFGAYLNRSIRNVVIDHQRSANSRNLSVGAGAESFDQIAEPRFDPDHSDQQIALVAFQSLSSADQEILRVTLLEESRAAEVGKQLGMSPGAVAVRAFRAREHLREAWLVAHTQAAGSAECARQRARMGAYARGNLGLRSARSLDRHLSECDPCREAFSEIDGVNRSLKALVLLPVAGGLVRPSSLSSGWALLRNKVAALSAGPIGPSPLRVVRTSSGPRRLLFGWAAPVTTAVTVSATAIVLTITSSAPHPPSTALPLPTAPSSLATLAPPPARPASPISSASAARLRPRKPPVTTAPAAAPSAAPSPSPSAAAALALPAPDLVSQSGFDSPHLATYAATFCSPTATTKTCRGTSLSGWSVTGDSVDLNSAAYVPPPPGDPAGTQCVDLIGQDFNASGRDGLRQSFATTAGGTYQLTFAMAPDPRSNTAVSSASVFVGGIDRKDLSFTNATANTSSSVAMKWTTQSVTFTSASASITIGFYATNTGSGGPELTDVQLRRIQ